MPLQTIYSYLDKSCAFITFIKGSKKDKKILDRYKNLYYTYKGGQDMVIRKIQRVNKSYYVILAKGFLRALKLHRGDYVKIWLEDTKICIEKLRREDEGKRKTT